MPDLSHLTDEERRIILDVMERQKREEEKEQSMLKVKEDPKPESTQWFKSPFSGLTDLVNNVLQAQTKSENEPQKEAATEVPETKLHQQFESYKDQVKKMAEESQDAPDQKAEAPICGICHKTKFADGCGHLCSYCQTKFCARCGGRVSLRSNKRVRLPMPPGVMRRRHEEAPQEKKAKLHEAPLLYQSTTVERSRAPNLLRQHSLDPSRTCSYEKPVCGDGDDGEGGDKYSMSALLALAPRARAVVGESARAESRRPLRVSVSARIGGVSGIYGAKKGVVSLGRSTMIEEHDVVQRVTLSSGGLRDSRRDAALMLLLPWR
ncbi:hypothetical protein HF521_010886 [Silurus meridionalis]|uniref:RabBD domain-containing protein n=1 Tax=Silurus meridionalis TaxID=175797 RepID=A0A8T0AHF3_SILME|nr:hypothetical protein HF521_010886 [Silurus meridionalis]